MKVSSISFRPLIRGFFFYLKALSSAISTVREFPSPHSGILFLLEKGVTLSVTLTDRVSVPSFGDSFFITAKGFQSGETHYVVSVPSFGDSFFIVNSR